MRAAKLERDVLADEQAPIGVDQDAGDEGVDREQAPRLRRRRGAAREDERQEQEGAADALSSRRRRAGPGGLRDARARSTLAWRTGRTRRSGSTGTCRWSC